MSPDIQYWYLRDHKLFSTLNNAQINELCVITRFKKAGRHEIIYFASDQVPRIYLLKKGMIKIVESDPDGREVIKDIIQKGDIFGELSLSGVNTTSEYAQAISAEVLICSFTLADFEKVLEKDPSISLKFSKFIGFKLKRLQNRYANLVFKDVRQRIVAFMHEWAEKEGNRRGSRWSCRGSRWATAGAAGGPDELPDPPGYCPVGLHLASVRHPNAQCP